MNLKDKVILVTGGASGIGECCVEEFLKNHVKGVVIADNNVALGEEVAKKLNNKYGIGKTTFVQTNVSDKDSFKRAFEKTAEAYANIDILINCAGIFDEINWERMIEINLIGTTHGCLLAINEYFPKYKSGTESFIINIASVSGLQGLGFCPHYASTKHGIIGLTRSLGANKSLAKEDVCMMAVCPGASDTAMNKDIFPRLVYHEELKESIDNFKPQKPSAVARSVIKILNEAENGSIWIIEENVLRKVVIPAMNDMITERSYNI